MTDSQLLTMALAVIIPLSMLLYSNSRITEAKETLRAEIAALRAELRADRSEARADHAESMAEFREVKHMVKVHELEHHK